jgi:hypothetical protein
MKKVSVNIRGTITGFAKEKEPPEETKKRIVLESEMRVNLIGDVRAHLSIASPTPEASECMDINCMADYPHRAH